MFEIGHTFRITDPTAELPDEREILAVIVAGAGVDGVGQGVGGAVNALRRVETALRLANLSLAAATQPGMHPGRCAEVAIDGQPAGHVGEVDPEVSAAWGIDGRVGWFEVDLGRVATAIRRSELAAPVSRFPSSDIDLAFVVAAAIPAAAVEAALVAAAGGLLEKISLFDVYRGAGVDDGYRSLAFRLRFCAFDRTLTDTEVGELRAVCIAAVESSFAARLRS
jgi:phenylalanyl-tRNA synthetase beta chain